MERKLAVSMFGQKRLSREGGIEIVAKELCTRMVQSGCTVTCYNRSGHHVSGAEYENKTEYEGIRQKYVPTIEKKGLAAVSSSFFAAFYSAFGKFDVVHIHAEGPAFFAWLPKLFGKKVVVTIHGIDWQREKWKSGFGSKFIRQGEKNAVKYADEIIVLSKGVQDYFKNTYDRDTWFIPNGVNRPEIRKAELITQKFGLTENSYILFLGRLVPEKGMCCGYYEKFKAGTINIEAFYKRRYEKLWPFFALLCILDVVISPSADSVYEIFANLTMLQGLLPNPQISVVGVSWTLAVIFVFYLLFPFFCFLLFSKKRAWLGFIIAGIYNILCQLYFFDEQHVLGNFMERENILYSAIFFMAGGLIYLYRDELERLKNNRIVAVIILAITASAYYFLSQNDLVMAVFSVAIIIFAITTDGKLGENKLIKKLSSISFEVYLSHMMIYRVLEKLKINHMFGLNAISYGVTAVLTLTGAIAFSYIAKVVLERV